LSFAGDAASFDKLLENFLSCRFGDRIMQVVSDISNRIRSILSAEVREHEIRCYESALKSLREKSKNAATGRIAQIEVLPKWMGIYRRRLWQVEVLASPLLLLISDLVGSVMDLRATRHPQFSLNASPEIANLKGIPFLVRLC
jgi:hypothetical protein